MNPRQNITNSWFSIVSVCSKLLMNRATMGRNTGPKGFSWILIFCNKFFLSFLDFRSNRMCGHFATLPSARPCQFSRFSFESHWNSPWKCLSDRRCIRQTFAPTNCPRFYSIRWTNLRGRSNWKKHKKFHVRWIGFTEFLIRHSDQSTVCVQVCSSSRCQQNCRRI